MICMIAFFTHVLEEGLKVVGFGVWSGDFPYCLDEDEGLEPYWLRPAVELFLF